jgi:hypothetical protein
MPLVVYPAADGQPLVAAGDVPFIWERRVGDGHLFYCGLSPSTFAHSLADAQRLRDLTRHAVVRAGGTYTETGYLCLRRGRYVIAKTFDTPLTLRGRFLDLRHPRLPLMEEVALGLDELTLLYDAAPALGGGPQLLYSSSCVEWRQEEDGRTRLYLTGALGTTGTTRLAANGRRVAALTATDARGQAVAVTVEEEGETVLLTYANQPHGVAVVVEWQQG